MKNEKSSFVKDNGLFIVVSILVSIIVLSAFAISFKSIMAVGAEIGVSIEWIFPILFEASAITGALGKVYLEVKGIKDNEPRNMANALLYIGIIMSITFNVYHARGLMTLEGWPNSVIIGLGHALPSAIVYFGAEFEIYMAKMTFAGDSLSDKIKELFEKLAQAHTDHETTQKELQVTRESNNNLLVEKQELTRLLTRYDNMPELLKVILAVHNEEKEVEELDKLFQFSQNRFTSLQKFMLQDGQDVIEL